MLNLARDLISLRKQTGDLRTGSYETVTVAEGVWAWRRGDSILVVVNMSDSEAHLEGVQGRIVVSTLRRRDGEAQDGALELEPWEGLVIDQENG
jgi:glycosidase